jgi:hypothetical protein
MEAELLKKPNLHVLGRQVTMTAGVNLVSLGQPFSL